MLVAEWALVRGGVVLSLNYFAVIELAIYSFEEGGALLWVRGEPSMYGPVYNVNAGPVFLLAIMRRRWRKMCCRLRSNVSRTLSRSC